MNFIREVFYTMRAYANRYDRNTAEALNRPDPIRALARNSAWSSRNAKPAPVKVVDNHPWNDYETR